jgi:outer membrane immunogenic protein
MKKFLIAGIAAAALSGAPALAADMPVKAAPALDDWSGFYLGVNGGYAWSDPTWTCTTANFYCITAGESFKSKFKGGTFGGVTGFNVQSGPLVAGIETTFNWVDFGQRQVGVINPAFPNDIYKTLVSNLGTLTGRVGYATGPGLLYAKGGWAYSQVDFNVLSGAPVAGFLFERRFWLDGWTVGGGYEVKIPSTKLIFGVEYDYTRLSNHNFSGATSPPSNLISFGVRDFAINEVLARVTYRFGP